MTSTTRGTAPRARVAASQPWPRPKSHPRVPVLFTAAMWVLAGLGVAVATVWRPAAPVQFGPLGWITPDEATLGGLALAAGAWLILSAARRASTRIASIPPLRPVSEQERRSLGQTANWDPTNNQES